MDAITYRGYSADVEFDPEDGIFIGRLADIDDIVGFHADTMAKLRSPFEEAVEGYIRAIEA